MKEHCYILLLTMLKKKFQLLTMLINLGNIYLMLIDYKKIILGTAVDTSWDLDGLSLFGKTHN